MSWEALIGPGWLALGFGLGMLATRSALQAGRSLLTAARKLESVPEMSRRADELLRLLMAHEKTELEWTARLQSMDRNQAKILNALLRAGLIRQEVAGIGDGLIVGSRPGLQETSPPAISGSRPGAGHI